MRSEKVWDQEAGLPHSTEGLSPGSWLWGGHESLCVVSLTLSLGESTPPPQRQAGPGVAGLAIQLRTPEQQQEKRPGTRASGMGEGGERGGRPAWSPQFWERAAGVGGEVSVT